MIITQLPNATLQGLRRQPIGTIQKRGRQPARHAIQRSTQLEHDGLARLRAVQLIGSVLHDFVQQARARIAIVRFAQEDRRDRKRASRH